MRTSQSSPNMAPKPAAGITKKSTGGLSLAKPIPGQKPKEKPLSPLEKKEGMVAFLDMEEYKRIGAIDQLLKPAEGPAIAFSISDLVAITLECGLTSIEGVHVVSGMAENVKGGASAERGLLLLQSLLLKMGRSMEPFVFPLFSRLLSLHADRSPAVRDLIPLVITSYGNIICPHAFRLIFPYLTEGMVDEDWRVKVGTLQLLKAISPRMSKQLSPLLPQIIPQVSNCIYDSKKQVQTAGLEALNEACRAISNEDIRHLTPQLVSVIARPDESAATLDSLLETTFVATVDSPTLALIAPLLGKALRGRSSALKRKAARVIDNMCRLVKEPADVAPFMPLLLPALDKVIDEIVDAEVCEVTKAAREILLKAMGEGLAAPTAAAAVVILDVAAVHKNLASTLTQVIPTPVSCAPTSDDVTLAGLSVSATGAQAASAIVQNYVAQMAAHLVVYDTLPTPPLNGVTEDAWKYALATTETGQWKDCVVPYMAAFRSVRDRAHTVVAETAVEDAKDVKEENSDVKFGEKISAAFRAAALGDVPDSRGEAEADDASLCDIAFSLAFGGKILLHNTHLRLGKGRRYGLMGKNGAGKTTLLTNIGSGNIEGMPPHLRMVYVQHDDASDDFGVPLIDEIMQGKDMIEAKVEREDVLKALRGIAFTEEMLHSPRSALSGGWKMKVLILRAMLSRADILLLDEPTNHLDHASVAWLTNYLQSQMEVTCLIVSHDTLFLDNVVTDIIHYETRKLVYYHGNLTHFVEIHPEAKYYYELESSTLVFKFPTPERLDGIASTTRSVMKMDNITYTYPGAAKPTLNNISVKLCLGSRVAVLGANGAGKSTLIKLLVQETEPDEGTGGEVWKHHNLRVAYVAQHSFHHVEQHLDSSPVDYMKWRFSGGVDREDLARPSLKLTEEEEQADKVRIKAYGDVDQVLGRRKNGKTMEYECSWIGQGERLVDSRRKNGASKKEDNKYIPLETMIELGLIKLVQQCDTRIAAANAGLDLRPLIISEIQGHLDDFNLEAEFGTHGSIRRMSGGQKVKLVLAAAMWNRPHIIVLDEPTNYLDREALGALTQAIKGFHGGVVIISHNSEFTDALCTENWIVSDGNCVVEGEAEETALKAAAAAGNKIRKSKSAPILTEEAVTGAAIGNTNKTKVSEALPLNPRTLEVLSKKEARLLSRCAETAGVTLKEYVSKISCTSPEWKWLGSFQKN